MEEKDKYWLAAAIDGEGSIGLMGKQKTPYIGVYNRYEDFCKKAMNIIGYGSVLGYKPKNPKHSVRYRYACSQRDIVLKVLKDIYPILIVKKNNAEIIINLIESKFNLKSLDNLESLKPGCLNSLNPNNHLKGFFGNSEKHRLSALKCENNHLKGFRGNPEQHRLNALKARNHHLKGFRGDSEQHSLNSCGIKDYSLLDSNNNNRKDSDKINDI